MNTSQTPEINLDSNVLSSRKDLVRIFYKELWDRQDLSLVSELLHPEFTFRGSLGPVLVGGEQFSQYVLWLTGILERYTSDILGLVEEGDQIAGRLRFHGIHRGAFFGIPPTGRHLSWDGAPIFTFEGDRIRDLWVLGDIHGLLAQLRRPTDQLEFSAC